MSTQPVLAGGSTPMPRSLTISQTMDTAAPSADLQAFFDWFGELEPNDQEAMIKLVHNEYRIRKVVRSFSSMSMDQRQEVFHRLGLPNELLNRIPPPVPGQVEEVEWKEWDNSPAA